jgi:2-amino-4-hydroxy-6-hydroxymethyldihydropteridine diphosphokinase
MINNIAFIGLGTNIGNREIYLNKAIMLLEADLNIKVSKTSSIYETDPIGYVEQASFLNMVVKIKTSYSPQQLIEKTMKIEAELGRERIVHWGPRTIDLDILLYNKENIESEHLMIPHPRMQERAFVLIPLLEIDGDILLNNVSLTEVLEQLKDKEGVRLWKRTIGAGEFERSES